ncbi:MAG: DUF4261 domain-containing protein [Clostridiaceae bacterium]|nr:DUF4261 domain-containing protein [Clostridiaceae bacterium]
MDLKNEAIREMISWLSDEHELGNPPSKIEIAGEFDYDDAHYYIMKFKKSMFSKWLVGVCGYANGEIIPTHTFSEFELYDKNTAKDKCIAIIEYLKEYWKNRARAEFERRGVTEEEFENMSDEEWNQKGKEADAKEHSNHMQGFILLKNDDFNFSNLISNLRNQWNLQLNDDESKVENGNLVFNIDDNLVAISLIPCPIPDGEAEYYAACNYMWKDAVEITKKHTAQVIVMVINHNNNSLEAASLFAKISSTCLSEPNALGIYTAGTVFEPKFYISIAKLLKQNELPIPDWIYIGFGQDNNGNSSYTYGLESFGKAEIEIVNSTHSFEELRTFLYYVCEYVIKNNMTFRDGETISFSSNNILKITKSKGIQLEGETIKIWY